jgi:hypothetical protein
VDLGTRYLELVLRFSKLAPSLVESFGGTADLLARIDMEPPPSARRLIEQAQEVGRLVQEHEVDPMRREWLSAQLAAIETALAWLGGAPLTYRELVARCHGVNVAPVSDEQFARAHSKLDRTLPGHGDVRTRYQKWAATQIVPHHLLLAGLQALADVLRRRSAEMFDLPAGEEASFELVTDKPWAGNANYLGGLRTRVEINQDLPITSCRLLELVSHEAYPGHHAEAVCKYAVRTIEEGRVEMRAYVVPSPQALISEGIACHALEILLGQDAEEIAARCLRPLGIPFDTEVAATVREAEQLLLSVRPNIALMLDEQRASPAEARTYARRWMLQDDEQVDLSVESLEDRDWRPYESCYPAGLDFCRRFTSGDPARFRTLLTEQITTTDLSSFQTLSRTWPPNRQI